MSLLKAKALEKSDLDEFVELYCRDDFSKRAETWSENEEGRWNLTHGLCFGRTTQLSQ